MTEMICSYASCFFFRLLLVAGEVLHERFREDTVSHLWRLSSEFVIISKRSDDVHVILFIELTAAVLSSSVCYRAVFAEEECISEFHNLESQQR